MDTENINSKFCLFLIIYIYSYTVCQINDNFKKGVLEHENSYFIDINDYHNLNLIVTTSQKIYTSDSLPNPISTFTAKVENYSMAATYNQNYILVACLKDSLLAKININTGDSNNLLDYNEINVGNGNILVPPSQICSLSIFENIVHIAIAQPYTSEDILFNKYYIIKLMLKNDGNLSPIIDSSFETKIYRFPEKYKKSISMRQLSCEVINDSKKNNENKLLCIYEIYSDPMKDQTWVNATTLDSDLSNLESNEIKIYKFSYASGFYISKSENTIIKCITRKMLFNITLNNNVIKYKKYIPVDNSYLDLIYFVKNFCFSSRVAKLTDNINRYYIQIASVSDNYYRIYDHNALSAEGVLKIFTLYKEATDTLYCIYISGDKIKYFSMTGVTNMFNIQSYSKKYKIISNTRKEYSLENDLIEMTKDYGTIEIESTLEIRDSNDFKYYNYLIDSNNLDNFPYNKTTNILSTVQTENHWYIYSFALIDKDKDYLRIFNLTNINITIETCAFQCSSCTFNFSTCVNCRNANYAKLKEKENDNNCYPINQLFEGYIYDSSTQFFEKCYSSCKFCDEKITGYPSIIHKCKICADGYYPSYQYPGNCYKINQDDLTSEKYVEVESNDDFSIVHSCSDIGKNYKIDSTGECVDSCPSSSSYYSYIYTPIDFSEQTNENITNNQYELKSISLPKYSFNNICYEECPNNTQIKDTTNECECLKAWHQDATSNEIGCYEEDYCSLYEYKYFASDVKECRSNGCPEGYFQFNFECYKDECPPDSNRESSNSYKCISQKNYCYINEFFQNVCSDAKTEEYKYKYSETNQYLKSCSESLIYTIDEIETYLYDGICYSQCPSQTEANETDKTCICKYYTYYTDVNENEYICYNESEICGSKIPLKDINICVDSIEDCINKGYKVFNDECYFECPDLTEEDYDNQNYCTCSYSFYRDNDNKLNCFDNHCNNKGYLYSNPDTFECFTSYEDCFSKNLFFINNLCFEDSCPEGTIVLTSINNETIKNSLIKELSINNTSLFGKQCVCDINRNWKFDTLNENIVQICIDTCDEGYEPDSITHKCVEKREIQGITNLVTEIPIIEEITNTVTEVKNNPSVEVSLNPDSSFDNDSNIINTNEKYQCPNDFPYKLLNNAECVKECNATDFFNGICIVNNKDSTVKDDMIDNIRNELLNHTLDELLKDVINGKKTDLITVQGNSIFTITTSDNQMNNKQKNESTIYLGECEYNLKQHYNISFNETLLIFKIDLFEDGSETRRVEYEIYNSKTKDKLDLFYCKDTKIKINIPAEIDTKNEFKYNPVSDYYNDFCFAYTTDDGTDINLKDRRNEFFDKNLSICESNCDYNGYNSDMGKVSCECQVKIKIPLMSEIVFNKDLLRSKFVDIKSNINLKVMKCYYILFTSEGLLYNIGSYIFLTIIFLNIILLIVFILKGYKILCNKIYEIIKDSNSYKNEGIMNNKEVIKSIIGNSKIIVNKKKKEKNNTNIKEPPKNFKNKKRTKTTINDESKVIKLSSYEVKVQSRLSQKQISGRDSSRNNIYIINSNITKIKKNKIFNKNKNEYYNDYEFNELSYSEALKVDKRTYLQYYFSVLRMRYLLAFTFFSNNDYNSKSIKICLFLFTFSLYFMTNSLFFTDLTMHKIFIDKGSFNFIYQIPQILYSSIISSVINSFITFLSLSEKNIIELKKDSFITENKVKNLIKCLKVKFFLFFIIDFSLLLLFWYYLSCFCAVYKNTQVHLIKDTLISFGISLIYPLLLYLLPGIFRIKSLRAKNANRECLYKLSKILQLI